MHCCFVFYRSMWCCFGGLVLLWLSSCGSCGPIPAQSTTPAVFGNRIFVGTTFERWKTLGGLYAFALDSDAARWKQHTSLPVKAAPVASGGLVFLGRLILASGPWNKTQERSVGAFEHKGKFAQVWC